MTYILIAYALLSWDEEDTWNCLNTWMTSAVLMFLCWDFIGVVVPKIPHVPFWEQVTRNWTWDNYLRFELWGILFAFLVILAIRHKNRVEAMTPEERARGEEIYRQQLMEMAAWKIINGK